MEQNGKAVTKAMFDSQIHLRTYGRSKSTTYLFVVRNHYKSVLTMPSHRVTTW
jgi:hypothetical protein